MTALEFVSYIRGLKTPDFESFNFYANFHIDPQEAVITRKNLLRYLMQMYKLHPKILLVGEAPGKDGCALTGIPFTSEYQIIKESFFNYGYEVYNTLSPKKERSATAIWQILSNKSEMPLMWNIYPFHPFNSTTRKNRTPNKEEIKLGTDVLNKIIEMFNIKRIYGIGRTSSNILKNHPLYVDYIRHPSYGGQSICQKQLEDILL